ncbi:MAG: RraA family protein [Vicinamibacterales bacterium]
MTDRQTGTETAARSTPRALELFEHMERTLYTAVVSDALDDLGAREQAMAEHLRPVGSHVKFVGWARTIACMDVYHLDADPYGLEIEAIDSILAGEVVVVATGGSRRNAPWGELLSTAAVARGARGAVVDGLVRDVRRIQDLGFPVFSAGTKPVDSKGRGRVVAYNVPVECAGVLVSPGDLVFADLDGVITIPAAMVDRVVQLATDKASRENHSRDELRNGAYLRAVYDKYGVL